MALPNLSDLVRSVSVTRANLPQVFTRHTIQSVNTLGMIACSHQQFIEGLPIISPVKIETNAFTQLVLINLAPPPFIQNVLIAGKNCFDAQHYRTPTIQSPLL